MINMDNGGHGIYERRTNAKAFAKNVFINQERKLED